MASASSRGKAMLVVFHRRGADCAFTTADVSAPQISPSKRSRSAAPFAAPSPSSHARAAVAAAPNPAMPVTFSVPARRSRSCGPPASTDSRGVPRRIASAPTPFGPCNLCAEQVSRSVPHAAKSVGTRPTHWVASVCSSTLAARHMRAMSAMGCSTPVSLLAAITLTRATSALRSDNTRVSASIDTRPFVSLGSHTTSASPSSCRRLHRSRTAECSRRLVTSTRRRVPASAPRMARSADSVPPLVNTSSRSVQPSSCATSLRASST